MPVVEGDVTAISVTTHHNRIGQVDLRRSRNDSRASRRGQENVSGFEDAIDHETVSFRREIRTDNKPEAYNAARTKTDKYDRYALWWFAMYYTSKQEVFPA